MERYSPADIARALQLAAYYRTRLHDEMPRFRTYYIDAMDDEAVDMDIPCTSHYQLTRAARALETRLAAKQTEIVKRLGALRISAYMLPKESQ